MEPSNISEVGALDVLRVDERMSISSRRTAEWSLGCG